MAASALAMPTAPSLVRDKDHNYFVDGRPVVGVTRSLSDARIIDMSGIPQAVLDKAAARGRRVHTAFEYHDLETLDESSLDDEVAGHLRAYKSFQRDYGFVPGLIEGAKFNAMRRYAGQLDRTGEIQNGTRTEQVILDFKTGAWQDGYFCQIVGGYGNFFTNPRRFRYIGLQTFKEGRYKVHEAKATLVEYFSAIFFSAVTCAQFRLAERKQ